MRRQYKVVDVFTSTPFKGNPVAVILDAQDLSDQQMQEIARWTNLSETTFLLPATEVGADYQLRIFTPKNELPFAGHPTLGSAFAALEAGKITPHDGVVVQECKNGLVRISVTGAENARRLTFDLPPATLTRLNSEDVDELEMIIGSRVNPEAPPSIVDIGAVWVVAQLPSANALLDLKPDFRCSTAFEKRLGLTGISLYGEYPSGGKNASIEVRSFAPSCGVNEDPVCGSGNGGVAVFRIANGQIPASNAHYTASQGLKLQRDGRIDVSTDDNGGIKIGGECVTCVDGTLKV